MNSAFALICWKDKILLFLRDDKPTIPSPNCWHLPGGGFKSGETSHAAVRRELKEEISHVPTNLKFLTRIKKPDNTYTHLYYAFVEDEEAKKFKHKKGEGQGINFFTVDQMKSLNLTRTLTRHMKFSKLLQDSLKQKDLSKFVLNVYR